MGLWFLSMCTFECLWHVQLQQARSKSICFVLVFQLFWTMNSSQRDVNMENVSVAAQTIAMQLELPLSQNSSISIISTKVVVRKMGVFFIRWVCWWVCGFCQCAHLHACGMCSCSRRDPRVFSFALIFQFLAMWLEFRKWRSILKKGLGLYPWGVPKMHGGSWESSRLIFEATQKFWSTKIWLLFYLV